MIRICPHCGEQIMFMEHTGDYVHTCNSQDLALDQEDVKIVGNYTEDGVTTNVITHSWNKIHPESPDDQVFTDRGKNALSYRTKQHQEYIKEPNERTED